MRPNVDVDEDTADAVRDYAEENGLLLRRAWLDVIETGVDEITEPNDNND